MTRRQACSAALGPARFALLNKADQVDAGPLNVTDQWVVLIDPVMMSAEEMAKLETLAREEQGAINSLLTAVGAADDATADAVIAAGTDHGFVAPEAPGDLGDLMLPTAQRPPDQVPDPRSPIGLVQQESIRAADQQQQIREVTYSTNEYGEEVTSRTST